MKDAKDRILLSRIVQHCDEIAVFVADIQGKAGRGEAEVRFRACLLHQRAVAMNLLQIGELAGRLSEAAVGTVGAGVPWHAIRGMRNWLVHAYQRADPAVIWKMAAADVPLLKAVCQAALDAPSPG